MVPLPDTMRLTTMGQMAKSVRARRRTDLLDTLESLKWYLWHGNVFRALQLVDDLEVDLEILDSQPEARKLLKAVHEFGAYIGLNLGGEPMAVIQRRRLRHRHVLLNALS